MNVYIVRHGETKQDKIFNEDGFPNAGLTDLGIKQAHLTGQYLSKLHFDAIYSSDLKRALQTAQIIASYQKNILDINIDKKIREIHMGVFHTSSEDAVMNDYPDFYNEYIKKDSDFNYPGGECGEDVLKRVLSFLQSINYKNFENICIVCHGGVIRSIISYYLGLPQNKRFNIYPYNCGISLLKYDCSINSYKVISINSISHLDSYTTF